MPTPRYPEDYELPLKPHEAYDRGLDTQLDPESDEDFTPTYHDGAPATNAGTRENSNPRLPHLKRKRKKSNPLLPVYLFRCAEYGILSSLHFPYDL